MIRSPAVRAARWASAQVRTLMVQLRGAGETGQDDAAEGHDDVEVTQPLGLRVHPVSRDSLEAFSVMRGDEQLALFLIDKGRRDGAVEPEVGGTVLHGLAEESAVIYIRASGAIEITPKAGQNVVLAEGILDTARKTDPVARNASLIGWMNQVTAAVNGLAPLSVTPFVGSEIGLIDGGNSRVKS